MSDAPIALTMGDPAGIGLELALAAWREGAVIGAPFFLLADPEALARIDRQLGLATPIEETTPAQAAEVFGRALPVVPLAAKADAAPGAPDPACAPAILEAIERAVECVRTGQARALVTNPIAKKTLYDAGFPHPGHTEYLGELAARWGVPVEPVMLIWSPLLAVVPVTIHIPLGEVKSALTRARIEATARVVDRDMRARFGVERPRIAVAGLNPHAGEGGAMGREEIELIAPAIATLRAEGIEIFGPLPADTMFHARARENYDVALTMYHDQGLIPAKTIAFDEGVNVTLGLPFVRTSPDHGTAFDIAGKGLADPASLVAALKLAGASFGVTLAFDGLPPLREVVAAHGIGAKKALGQNFLFDLNLTGRIARAAGPLEGVTVIEVGPGPGGLTRALLAAGAARVVAIERDARCLDALGEIAAHWPGRLDVIADDALSVDFAALAQAATGPVRVCANLPYNIATPLLVGWLGAEPWPPWFDRLTLMFQREVAERIAATPETRADYGRLGVLTGWRAEAKILFDVPASAFTPPPKVTSSVVQLIPRAAPAPCRPTTLAALTLAAFGQRRKMLRQSLKGFAAARGLDLAQWLGEAGLEATVRAEEVSVSAFAALALAADRR